jgi:Ulp1 family protease
MLDTGSYGSFLRLFSLCDREQLALLPSAYKGESDKEDAGIPIANTDLQRLQPGTQLNDSWLDIGVRLVQCSHAL